MGNKFIFSVQDEQKLGKLWVQNVVFSYYGYMDHVVVVRFQFFFLLLVLGIIIFLNIF